MMFLLRTAFWLAVVLALLPSFGPKASTPAATGVEATEAVTAASATLGDMFQFCSRQPNACATGVHLASAIGQRAQAGAKMIYGMVGDKLAKTEGAGDESTSANLPTADVKVSQNTLTPADLTPAWRGSRRKGQGRDLNGTDCSRGTSRAVHGGNVPAMAIRGGAAYLKVADAQAAEPS